MTCGSDDSGDERDPLTRLIIAGAFDVSNAMGPGFLERVYRRCLALEPVERGIDVREEAAFKIRYKSRPVGRYVADRRVIL